MLLHQADNLLSYIHKIFAIWPVLGITLRDMYLESKLSRQAKDDGYLERRCSTYTIHIPYIYRAVAGAGDRATTTFHIWIPSYHAIVLWYAHNGLPPHKLSFSWLLLLLCLSVNAQMHLQYSPVTVRHGVTRCPLP